MEVEYVPDPQGQPKRLFLEQFERYLLERMFDEIEAVLLLEKGEMDQVSLDVCFVDFHDFNPGTALSLIYHPTYCLALFDEALRSAQKKMFHNDSFRTKHSRDSMVIKRNLHVRITSLPSTPQFSKASIGDIRADDKHKFVQFSGTVVRTGAVRVLDASKSYVCLNRECCHTFVVPADDQQDNTVRAARECPNILEKKDRQGKIETVKCGHKNVREIDGSKVCVDYQEIKVQDQIERLTLGSMPRSIIVVLEGDLVDKCNAGDDIVIVGVLVKQWKPVFKGMKCPVDIAVKANSVKALKFQAPLQGNLLADTSNKFRDFWGRHLAAGKRFTARDIIVGSVCPQLYGLFHVKMAVLLTLIGGSATVTEGGVRRRNQSHLLLVGDPGCGKSQILRFAAMVASRSVLTTGVGTTGAGLTCSMVRDGSEWTVEAGALVLSNNGVCCIDEFASIKEADRATIHEAMEQQTLSLAKAGLVVKLHTRCSVIACCNPKGSVYDLTADLTVNTAIASPLLSRFDLVLVLLDTPEKEWDKRVSTFLLQQAVDDGCSDATGKENVSSRVSFGSTTSSRRRDSAPLASPDNASHSHKAPVNNSSSKACASGDTDVYDDVWKLGTLRQYINLVRNQLQPTMGLEAGLLLQKYYSLQRQQNDQASRTTVRLFESLVRLSEAHAKLMFRNVVELEDAVVAVSCVILSQVQSSYSLKNDSTLHAPFPTESEASYQEQEQQIFAQLHCSRASLKQEANGVGKAGGGSSSSFSSSSSSAFSPSSSSAFPRALPAPAPSLAPVPVPVPASVPYPQQYHYQHQQQRQQQQLSQVPRALPLGTKEPDVKRSRTHTTEPPVVEAVSSSWSQGHLPPPPQVPAQAPSHLHPPPQLAASAPVEKPRICNFEDMISSEW